MMYISTLLIFLIGISAYSQVVVFSPFQEDITACYQPSNGVLQLIVQEPTGDVGLNISFPNGIHFVNNSVTVDNTTGYEIEENATGFSVDFDFSLAQQGDIIEVNFERSASCDAITGVQLGEVLQDNIDLIVNGNIESSQSQPYTLLYATLNIAPITDMSFEPHAAFTVPIEIINGGLGCIDEFEFVIAFDASKMTLITATDINNNEIDFESNSEGVVFTFGLGSTSVLNDGCFANNEAIQLALHFSHNVCLQAFGTHIVTYSAQYGCTESNCNQGQTQSHTISFFNPFSTSQIDVEVLDIVAHGLCTDGSITLSISNSADYLASTSNDIVFSLFSTLNEELGDLFSFHTMTIGEYEFNEVIQNNAHQFQLENESLPNTELSANNDALFNDLGPNSNIVVSFDYSLNCENYFLDHLFDDIQVILEIGYDNICTVPFSILVEIPIHNYIHQSAYVTGDVYLINDGQDYAFQYCVDVEHFMNCPNQTTTLSVVLPIGVIPSPNEPYAFIEEMPITNYALHEDTLTFPLIPGSSVQCLDLMLQLACIEGVIYESEILFNLDHYCSSNCSCHPTINESPLLIYNTVIPDDVCDISTGFGGSETNGGSELMSNFCNYITDFDAYRITTGFADFNFDDLVVPSSEIMASDVVYPCDQFRVESTSYISSDVEKDYIEAYVNGYFPMGNNETLIPIEGSLEIRLTSGEEYVIPIDISTVETSWSNDALFVKVPFDFNTFNPSFSLFSGDELDFYIDIEVNSSVLDLDVSSQGFDITPFRHYYFARDTMLNEFGEIEEILNIACSARGKRFFMGQFEPLEYIETSIENTNCGLYDLQINYTDRSAYIFTDEVRPRINVDSIHVSLPNSFSIVDENITLENWPNALLVSSNSIAVNEWDDIVTYSFVNDGLWPLSIPLTTIEELGLLINATLENECSSAFNGAEEFIQTTIFFTENVYTENSNCFENKSISDEILVENVGEVGVSSFSNNIASYYTNSTDITVLVCPIGVGSFDFTFAIIEMNDSFSISNIQGAEVITMADGNLLLTLETTQNQNCGQFTCAIERLICESLEVNVFGGWNCNGYPESLAAYECAPYLASQLLTLDFVQSEIQVDTEIESTEILVCDTMKFEIIVNSAQLAAVHHPTITLNLPPLQGLTFVEDIELEYPLDAPIRIVTASIIDGQLLLDLSELDNQTEPFGGLFENGLAGVETGDLAKRQAKIYLSFVSTCDFISGTSLHLAIQGDNICGDQALGSGIVQLLQPIVFENILPEYNTIIESDFNLECNEYSTLDVSITNLNGNEISNQDSILLFIPDDLEFIGITPNDIVGQQMEISGFTYVQLPYPDQFSPGDEFQFQIEFSFPETYYCTNDVINIQIQTIQQSNAYCISEEEDCSLFVQTNLGDSFQLFDPTPEPVSFDVIDVLCTENNTAVTLLYTGSQVSFLESVSNITFAYNAIDFEGEFSIYPETIGTYDVIVDYDNQTITIDDLPTLAYGSFYIEVNHNEVCGFCGTLETAEISFPVDNLLADVYTWYDENNNGIWENNESALPNVTFFIEENSGDETFISVASDENGYFQVAMNDLQFMIHANYQVQDLTIAIPVDQLVTYVGCDNPLLLIPYTDQCQMEVFHEIICTEEDDTFTYVIHEIVSDYLPITITLFASEMVIEDFPFTVGTFEDGGMVSFSLMDAGGCEEEFQEDFNCTSLGISDIIVGCNEDHSLTIITDQPYFDSYIEVTALTGNEEEVIYRLDDLTEIKEERFIVPKKLNDVIYRFHLVSYSVNRELIGSCQIEADISELDFASTYMVHDIMLLPHQLVTFYLFDVQGKLVLSSEHQTTVNMQFIPSGLYLGIVKFQNQDYQFKVYKK